MKKKKKGRYPCEKKTQCPGEEQNNTMPWRRTKQNNALEKNKQHNTLQKNKATQCTGEEKNNNAQETKTRCAG